MKAAVVRDCYVVERTRSNIYALVLVATLCFCGGFAVGDWTAEPRFAEREASLRDYVASARDHADRVAESIRKGCYAFVDPRPGSSRFIRGM